MALQRAEPAAIGSGVCNVKFILREHEVVVGPSDEVGIHELALHHAHSQRLRLDGLEVFILDHVECAPASLVLVRSPHMHV